MTTANQTTSQTASSSTIQMNPTFKLIMKAMYRLVWLASLVTLLAMFANDKIGFWGSFLWVVVTNVVADFFDFSDEKVKKAKKSIDKELDDEIETRKKMKSQKETDDARRKQHQKEIDDAVRRATQAFAEQLKASGKLRTASKADDETMLITHDTVTMIRNTLMKHHNSHGADRDYMASNMAAQTSRMIQMLNDELNKGKARVRGE